MKMIKSSVDSNNKGIILNLMDECYWWANSRNRGITDGEINGYYEGEVTPGEASDLIIEIQGRLYDLADDLEYLYNCDEEDNDEYLEALKNDTLNIIDFCRDKLTDKGYEYLDENIFKPLKKVAGIRDEAVFNSRKNIIRNNANKSFPEKIVEGIMSGLYTEKQAIENISQKQSVNIGYARQILSNWMEEYKPQLIKSGILDIADDINKEFDRDGDLDSWFNDYVPQSGGANTIGGEIVRAAMRILYRWYNDGDMIGKGYGNQTCNPAARYLLKYLPDDRIVREEIESLLNHDKVLSEEEYDSFAETLKSDVEDFLRDNEELFHQPSKSPYEDSKDPYEDKDTSIGSCIVTDSDGNEYYFDDIGDQWRCSEVSLKEAVLEEDDYISDGDEYSDYIDSSEEYGSFNISGVDYDYEATDEADDDGMYHEWKIISVRPSDPFCDEGDILNYYDLEPDNLGYGFTLYDMSGNEIDQREFLASSLVESKVVTQGRYYAEVNSNGEWVILGENGVGNGSPIEFKNQNDANSNKMYQKAIQMFGRDNVKLVKQN